MVCEARKRPCGVNVGVPGGVTCLSLCAESVPHRTVAEDLAGLQEFALFRKGNLQRSVAFGRADKRHFIIAGGTVFRKLPDADVAFVGFPGGYFSNGLPLEGQVFHVFPGRFGVVSVEVHVKLLEFFVPGENKHFPFEAGLVAQVNQTAFQKVGALHRGGRRLTVHALFPHENAVGVPFFVSCNLLFGKFGGSQRVMLCLPHGNVIVCIKEIQPPVLVNYKIHTEGGAASCEVPSLLIERREGLAVPGARKILQVGACRVNRLPGVEAVHEDRERPVVHDIAEQRLQGIVRQHVDDEQGAFRTSHGAGVDVVALRRVCRVGRIGVHTVAPLLVHLHLFFGKFGPQLIHVRLLGQAIGGVNILQTLVVNL